MKTVTAAVATFAMSAAVMAAVNFVLETKVMTRSVPFQRTMEPLIKLLPFTISVKAGSVLKVEVGLRLAMTGTGLLTVNEASDDNPPPGVGVKTVTFKMPAAATSAANKVADNCVSETKLVTRSAPLTLTTEFGRKLLPVKVRVKLFAPTSNEVGLSVVRTGAGF